MQMTETHFVAERIDLTDEEGCHGQKKVSVCFGKRCGASLLQLHRRRDVVVRYLKDGSAVVVGNNRKEFPNAKYD